MSLLSQQPLPPVPDGRPRGVPARQSAYASARPARVGVRRRRIRRRLPPLGQPAYTPWRLALVTLMQFREVLSDRQVADAVRGRIDLKHLLALELDDPGSD